MNILTNMAHLQYHPRKWLIKASMQIWCIYLINWLSYHVNKDDGNRRKDAGDDSDALAEEAEEHCLAYEYKSRNIHQTCELNNMSPAGCVRFGSDTEQKLCCYM